jgi:effector-binding domain-containing protein
MLKIGDFSKFCRVSVKTLRYYDEIGILKPIRVDQFTGYRYYSAEQLSRINRIMDLKDLGLSLEEINQIMTNNLSRVGIIELLRKKQDETLKRLREEEARLKKVEKWLDKVKKEGNMPASEVVIKRIEAQIIVAVRGVIPTYGDIGLLFNELCSYLGRKRVKYAGPPMALYHDAEYRERDADMEVAVPILSEIKGTDKIKVRQLEGVEQMACIIHKGPYEELSRSYSALMEWVETNKYEIAGLNREIYIKGPGQVVKGNPANYVTELQLPVKKS